MDFDESDDTETADIVRTIDLGVTDAEAWDLVSTEDGWSRWLVDSATVDIDGHGVGTVLDDEVTREVRVDTVDRSTGTVRFVWTDRDDPDDSSEVTIRVIGHPSGPTRVLIAERRLTVPTASAQTSAAERAWSRAIAWEVRATLLWAECTARVLV